MGFTDGYGQVLDRKDGVCYNLYASVVVMITDTCPCHYPNNLYSNKRWCCNDKYHLDMSVWAYEKVRLVRLVQDFGPKHHLNPNRPGF
jgi:hypothetical protein